MISAAHRDRGLWGCLASSAWWFRLRHLTANVPPWRNWQTRPFARWVTARSCGCVTPTGGTPPLSQAELASGLACKRAEASVSESGEGETHSVTATAGSVAFGLSCLLAAAPCVARNGKPAAEICSFCHGGDSDAVRYWDRASRMRSSAPPLDEHRCHNSLFNKQLRSRAGGMRCAVKMRSASQVPEQCGPGGGHRPEWATGGTAS